MTAGTISSCSRMVWLCGALALGVSVAACAGTDTTTLLAPATAPTLASAGAPEPARPEAPKTAEQLNTECWMRAEADRKLHDIDARLAAVNRCVAERGGKR
jgi:hypothetical protein